jgi:NAD(P)-dependent dehydrogenase (short-subunit alcohol dehydrogenase family)
VPFFDGALGFAKEGARLVVTGRGVEQGKAFEDELRALGTEALFIKADVRSDDEVGNLVDKAVARFGRVDAAVNVPAPRVSPGRSSTKPPRVTLLPSIPMCLACCSARITRCE